MYKKLILMIWLPCTLFLLSSCASKPAAEKNQPAPHSTAAPIELSNISITPTLSKSSAESAPHLGPTNTVGEKEVSEIKIELRPKNENSASKVPVPPPPSIDNLAQKVNEKANIPKPTGVEPEQALKWLKNGNTRFLKGYLRKDGASKKDVARLTAGQTPHSVILACSDSRVPPEIIFDQKLGELYVVRTVGESLDSVVIASVEYAIDYLGARNIVVLGHSQCGAVKAALSSSSNMSSGSPHLDRLVADLHPHLTAFSDKEYSRNFVGESWANAKGVAKDLISRSTIIGEKVRTGEVKISSAMYILDQGTVEFE